MGTWSEGFAVDDRNIWSYLGDAAYDSSNSRARMVSGTNDRDGQVEYDYGSNGGSFDAEWRLECPNSTTSGFHNIVFFGDGADSIGTGDGTTLNNGYRVNFSVADDKIAIQRFSNGSGTTLNSVNTAVDPPETFRVDVDLSTSTIDVYKGSTNVVSASPSSIDTTYSKMSWEAGHFSDSAAKYIDNLSITTNLSAPGSPGATANNDGSVGLSWTDAATEIEYEVYRATSTGSRRSDYNRAIDGLAADTTSASESNTSVSAGTTYYYRIASVDETIKLLSAEVTATPQLANPTSVSLSYTADDSLDVSYTDNSDEEDNYHVQISRDGATYTDPTGGPATPGAVSGTGTSVTQTYTPSSDSAYGTQVGIDSSFQFRVRAESASSTSDWVATGGVYTAPIPPHAPSASRSASDSITISWSNQSGVQDGTEVQYREDSGTGYGAWTTATTTASTATSVTFDTSNQSWMQTDARYQFRLRHVRGTKSSAWAYSDYGNAGNVYFSDGFESGGLTNWTSTSLGDTDSGVVNNTATPDTGIAGSEEGSYHLRLDAADTVTKDFGDLSAASDVLVKLFAAAGSRDSDGEPVLVEWYDGSAWQTLDSLSWEYNKQGWIEAVVLVPSSYLSTDNRLRLNGNGSGGADHAAFDRVVVADLLHEYTTPAAPSSLALDDTVEDELGASWTVNATFEDDQQADIKRSSDTSNTVDATLAAGITSHTYTGLDDGEEYDTRIRSRVEQDRRGSLATRWTALSSVVTAITVLPAPTQLASPAHTDTSIDLAWTDNHDYGDTEVQYKRDTESTWTTFSTLAISTEAETITGLLNGELYDLRVRAHTEHTTTVDA